MPGRLAGERPGSRPQAASLRGGIAGFVVLLSGMMVICSSPRTKVMQIGWMPKERSRILPAAGGLPHPQGARKAGKRGIPHLATTGQGGGFPCSCAAGKRVSAAARHPGAGVRTGHRRRHRRCRRQCFHRRGCRRACCRRDCRPFRQREPCRCR